MSLDYLVLWLLTVANSMAVILVVRQLAQHPAYRPVTGPKAGSAFAQWTLQTLHGDERSSAQMPSDYTMIVASENCGPCHTLLNELAQSGRVVGTLVIAVDGDAPKLREAAHTSSGPLWHEFLTGADAAFKQRFKVPGTPFALAIRRERVVIAGPARTVAELETIANTLQSGAAAPARLA